MLRNGTRVLFRFDRSPGCRAFLSPIKLKVILLHCILPACVFVCPCVYVCVTDHLSSLSLYRVRAWCMFMRGVCVEAGLIPPLVQLLSSKEQEVLLQTGRALGNICYDSRKSHTHTHTHTHKIGRAHV